jgi:hypothetical protein
VARDAPDGWAGRGRVREWKALVCGDVISEVGWLYLRGIPSRSFCVAPRDLAVWVGEVVSGRLFSRGENSSWLGFFTTNWQTLTNFKNVRPLTTLPVSRMSIRYARHKQSFFPTDSLPCASSRRSLSLAVYPDFCAIWVRVRSSSNSDSLETRRAMSQMTVT